MKLPLIKPRSAVLHSKLRIKNNKSRDIKDRGDAIQGTH